MKKNRYLQFLAWANRDKKDEKTQEPVAVIEELPATEVEETLEVKSEPNIMEEVKTEELPVKKPKKRKKKNSN